MLRQRKAAAQDIGDANRSAKAMSLPHFDCAVYCSSQHHLVIGCAATHHTSVPPPITEHGLQQGLLALADISIYSRWDATRSI